jgi:hypothetical protein
MNAFGRIAAVRHDRRLQRRARIRHANPRLDADPAPQAAGLHRQRAHEPLWPRRCKELGGLVATGKLKYRETVAEGLAARPGGFLGLLKGRNFGKQLVRLVWA